MSRHHPRPDRTPRLKPVPHLLLALLTPLSVVPAFAQQAPLPTGVQSDGATQYIGDAARVSIGVRNGGEVQGEIAGVLKEDADSAWLGEVWIAKSAGGGKLSYHRLADDAVQKYTVALDQNESNDRKATVGFGLEKEHWFGDVYVSRAVTGQRLLKETNTTTSTPVSGMDGERPFIDTISRVTTNRLFERAYENGVGFRVGHYYDEHALRLTGGADVEWGATNGGGDARQTSLSVTAEKFYAGTPHSVALQVAVLNRTGGIDTATTSNETRAMVSYRYALGKPNSQPGRLFRMVQDPRPATLTALVASSNIAATEPTPAPVATTAAPASQPSIIPARTEKVMVKTKATMRNDAFFEIASNQLTKVARAELDRVIEILKTTPYEGNIHIVGHTCDLGSAVFNQILSVKRANAVRDYLVSTGVIKADQIVTEGKGKTEPKYPNARDTRAKNRRVDLEFVTIVSKEDMVTIPEQIIPAAQPKEPPITFHQEVIKQEPSWMRRALRTPSEHKRTVDTYRTSETQETSVASTRTYTNRTPVAKDDTYMVSGTTGTPLLSVLTNDTDPDGDGLRVLSITQPAGGNGTVSILSSGSGVAFVPKNVFTTDTFSYTITDGKGGNSTANVLLIDP